MIGCILMGNLLKREISDSDLEKIANDTAKEILYGLKKGCRPSSISLYGANPRYLIKVMVKLSSKLEEYEKKNAEDLNIKIFIGDLKKGYSVNVGAYLNSNPLKDF